VFAAAYGDARERALAETGVPEHSLPLESPYTLEQTLDSDFLPD
jgi:hypothetical protein